MGSHGVQVTMAPTVISHAHSVCVECLPLHGDRAGDPSGDIDMIRRDVFGRPSGTRKTAKGSVKILEAKPRRDAGFHIGDGPDRSFTVEFNPARIITPPPAVDQLVLFAQRQVTHAPENAFRRDEVAPSRDFRPLAVRLVILMPDPV